MNSLGALGENDLGKQQPRVGSKRRFRLIDGLTEQRLNGGRNLSRRFVREVYMDITPNRSALDLQNVPDGKVTRFTPDGRYLIVFSMNRMDIELFEVAPLVDEELHGDQKDVRTGTVSFETFFPRSRKVSIAPDGDKVIDYFLCSATGRFGLFFTTSNPNENTNAGIATIVLCAVDLHEGRVTDRFEIPEGIRRTTDPHGGIREELTVHMLENRLALLSKKPSIESQIVHIIDLREDTGKLYETRRVGPYANVDDTLEIEQVRQEEEKFRKKMDEIGTFSLKSALTAEDLKSPELLQNRRSGAVQTQQVWNHSATAPTREPAPEAEVRQRPVGARSNLHHKVLIYIFRKVIAEEGSVAAFRKMTRCWSMSMLKIQMLDTSTLFLLLGPLAKPAGTTEIERCVFVLYDFSSDEVFGLFWASESSEASDLATIYRKYPELFERSSAGRVDAVRAIMRSKDRSHDEADPVSATTPSKDPSLDLALLSTLPVQAQKRNWSPYFDQSIFSYEKTELALLDGSQPWNLRPQDEPRLIRFSSRENPPQPLFKLKSSPPRGRGRACRFLFHPYLPLVLCFQHPIETNHSSKVLDIHYRAS